MLLKQLVAVRIVTTKQCQLVVMDLLIRNVSTTNVVGCTDVANKGLGERLIKQEQMETYFSDQSFRAKIFNELVQ